MWGTLSFTKTLSSVRQMGARLLCVCYVSVRCIEGREDGYRAAGASATAPHSGEGRAQLRAVLSAPLPAAQPAGSSLPLPLPPRPSPTGNPARTRLHRCVIALARTQSRFLKRYLQPEVTSVFRFLWVGCGSFGLTRTPHAGRLSAASRSCHCTGASLTSRGSARRSPCPGFWRLHPRPSLLKNLEEEGGRGLRRGLWVQSALGFSC